MESFETVNEIIGGASGLFQQRLLLKPPAFMRERGRDHVAMLPVTGGQTAERWCPHTPVHFFENNRHWARCVSNLVYVAGASELTKESGLLDAAKFRKSRVITWIDRLRCLCHARDTRQLPNPTYLSRTAAEGERKRVANDLLWDGAKLTHRTFEVMVADLKSQLASRPRGGVFPFYPHIETQMDIVENYKLCILHSSTVGERSDAHMKLACMLEACCPHLFPSVPATSAALGDELVEKAIDKFHKPAGLDNLARQFARLPTAPPVKAAPPGRRDTNQGMRKLG